MSRCEGAFARQEREDLERCSHSYFYAVLKLGRSVYNMS
jgi:hypothetical protein